MDSAQQSPFITIPVIVDVTEPAPGLTRAVYFCFEAIEPSPGWYLATPVQQVPFLLLDVAGIIFGPTQPQQQGVDRPQLFLDPALIQATFEVIESTGDLMVVSAGLYVPTSMFHGVEQRPQRHMVYRLRADVFVAAHRASREMWQVSEYQRLMDHYKEKLPSSADPPPIQHSPKETSAFAAWSLQQLVHALDGYQEQANAGEVAPRSDLDYHRVF